MQPKNISKAWKPWIQALGSFSQAMAWRLQGSVPSLNRNLKDFHEKLKMLLGSSSSF